MNKAIIILLAALAFGCSQQKQITSKEKPVHRYTTVYEGNRIVRYSAHQPDSVYESQQRLEAPKPESRVEVKRPEIAALPYQRSTALKEPKKKAKRFSSVSAIKEVTRTVQRIAKEKKKRTPGGQMVWLGLLMLIIAAVLVGIGIALAWGDEEIAVILLIAGLLAFLTGLIFLIIGLIRSIQENRSKVKAAKRGVNDQHIRTGSFWSLIGLAILVLVGGIFLMNEIAFVGLVVAGIGFVSLVIVTIRLIKVIRHNRHLKE